LLSAERQSFWQKDCPFHASLRETHTKYHRGHKESRLNPCYENVKKMFIFMVVLLDTVV
jgi:hypothetical protein